jgi:hypothetical protein
MIEEPAPTTFLQLGILLFISSSFSDDLCPGRDSFYQAQQMKSGNILESIQFYREASSYFTKAIQMITDQTVQFPS